jgi:hypothetical protein
VLALLMACLGRGEAAPPAVSQVEVTDVTPKSFAVTWLSSEAATGSLILYQGDCATPLANLPMTSEGNDATGNIRVTVAELAAGTGYCYQTVTTSLNTAEATVYPVQPAAVTTANQVNRVTTAAGQSVPFANDLLLVPPVYLPSPTDTPVGILALMYLLDGKGKGPISVLLGYDETKNYLNLNNLFDATTAETINLTGGERVRIVERHGRPGCAVERFRTVPADAETTRAADFIRSARAQDIDANGRVDILDILRIAAGRGSANGAPCFNSELDLNGDSRIDLQDVVNAEENFDATR